MSHIESKNWDVDTINNSLEETELVDSILTTDLNKLLVKFNKGIVYHVPFNLDSAYMSSFEEVDESTLTNAEVKYLSANLVENKTTNWAINSINSFIEIDSLKLIGSYEEYVDNLDVGMMKESDANCHEKINIDENNFILFYFGALPIQLMMLVHMLQVQ